MLARHRILQVLLVAGLVAASLDAPGPARAGGMPPLKLLATARINNSTLSVTFRLDPRQARVSEIRIRSGSLAVQLESVEILFADGGHARIAIDDSLPPGRQSRPIPVDSKRAVSQVLVFKRPGLRPGETVLQLLGVPAR